MSDPLVALSEEESKVSRDEAMAAAFRSAEFWECEICGDCWVAFMTTRFYPRSLNPLRWLARHRSHWHGGARRLSRNHPGLQEEKR